MWEGEDIFVIKLTFMPFILKLNRLKKNVSEVSYPLNCFQ
jgi:hypothetical protein